MAKEFWESKWKNKETGWDLQQVSPPIQEFIDKLTNKDLRILIPGCGNAYEAEYLFENGFKNVFIAEISKTAINSFRERYPRFPQNQIFQLDFFELNAKFDLIIEQTFFCAINPSLRDRYVEKVASLLSFEGVLAGVLFNRHFSQGPPYGGDIDEYRTRFKPCFKIKVMEKCYNSVQPRQGSEVFIILQLK